MFRVKTSAMQPNSELRQQRIAFLAGGAIWLKIAFSFVTFLLAKQKKSKGNEGKDIKSGNTSY